MKIIIYGLGKNGKEFIYDIQKAFNIKIIAITDTFVQKLDPKMEIIAPYIEPASISKYIFDFIIIATDKYYDEIKELLLNFEIPEYKIKSVKDFLGFFGKSNNESPYCIMCENKVPFWRNIGEDNEIFHYKKIVGGSKRRGGCPICGSNDRERYVYYILNNYTDIFFNKSHRILHFAPEFMLSQRLCARGGGLYFS